MSTCEKLIARLDTEKKEANELLMNATDPNKAMDLHNQVEALGKQLEEAESRWLELHQELEGE